MHLTRLRLNLHRVLFGCKSRTIQSKTILVRPEYQVMSESYCLPQLANISLHSEYFLIGRSATTTEDSLELTRRAFRQGIDTCQYAVCSRNISAPATHAERVTRQPHYCP